MMPEPGRLSRRLNFSDAVVIGMGAMIGTGVFVALGPAAESAGSGLILGLLAAAFAAYCNAASSAQLASVYPESGGTYVYGRKQLGPFWGWLAGWSFVAGKLASCAAAALTFGFYLHPPSAKVLAVIALGVLTFINYRGIQKSAQLTWLLLLFVLTALSVIVFASFFGGQADFSRLNPVWGNQGIPGILRSGAILFFAFAGYARVATLGEEVSDPRRTIPKATVTALAITLSVYGLVAVSVLAVLGAEGLSNAKAPLAAAVEAGKFKAFSPVVRLGAAAATLGVLLSLILGISRTVFAMSSNGDFPKWFAAVHPRFKIPHHAEIAVALVIAAVILAGDIRSTIGFSAFTILFYYAVTNAAAMTLPREKRFWPRWIAGAGFLFCLLLAFSLPAKSLFLGGGIILSGAVLYFLKNRKNFF